MHASIHNLGLYQDLIQLLAINSFNEIPNVDQLNEWAHQMSPEFTELGLSFVAQDECFDWQGQYYEEVIYNRGVIPTRIAHWHDFFNACIWLVFPKTKQLLNRLHINEIAIHGLKKRSKCRDAITLLDECGVIIATHNNDVIDSLRMHQWHQHFWLERKHWQQDRQAFVFGHANYEMGLSPFIGLTGKAFFISVDTDFFTQSLTQKYKIIDASLVQLIGDKKQLSDNTYLSPLPLLGVPQWYNENENEDFYFNTQYFRPKRQVKAR